MQKLYTESQRKLLVKNFEIETRTGHMQKPVIKLFNPSGIGTWYISSMTEDGNIGYGVCKLQETEIGSIDMQGIAEIRTPPFRLPIERDLYFTSNKHTIEECMEKHL